MNPDSSINPRAALESSLTALLLGELPHEQAAALHLKLAEDAELAKLYERLKLTINLVRETVASPVAETATQPVPLRLSDQRRQKLLQQFKTVAPKEFILPPRRSRPRQYRMPWLVPVGIAAALVVLMAVTLAPNFFAAKTRSMGPSFGTWSLSESASTAPASPVVTESPIEVARLASAEAKQNLAVKELPQQAGEVAPPADIPPAARPAGAVIVLPKATELAYAATTPAASEGVQPGFDVSATTKGFYDDSLGRAGGMVGGGGVGGGGGASGGFGGGLRGDASAAEGRQQGVAAAVEGEQIQAFGDSLKPPLVAANSSFGFGYKADGIVPSVGTDGEPLPSAPQNQDLALRRRYGLAPETPKDTGASTGASSAAWYNSNNPTTAEAFFSKGQETRGLANIEAPPPAAVPPPSVIAAPAQETLGKAVVNYAAATPAPAFAEPALVKQNAVVAGAPMHGLADNKVAGDLTAGVRTAVPIQSAADAGKASEVLPKSEVPGLVTSNQRDQKALGFDFYAGNALVSNGHLAAQGGTAPFEADLASIQEKKSELLPPSEPALAASGTVPLVIKLPAPAFKSMPTDVPVLGNVPAAGRLFRPPAAAPAVIEEANSDLTTPSQKKDDISSLGVTRAQPEGRAKTEELANYDKENGASRPVRSPIVLSGASPETSLTLNDADARDKQPRAAGALQLKVEENPKSVELLAKLDTAASGVEKLHEEFQVANSTAAPNAPKKEATAESLVRRERLLAKGAEENQLDDGKKMRPVAPAPVPQPEVQTAENAFSTFSLNVSDVSFKLAAASLEKGVMPEPATVRSEEFINAFDYRDPEPPPGVPVAFAWERAQYPFAQNRDLLRFSVKTAALGRQPGRPLNIVLLLDNSGSMERADRVRIIHEALRVLAGQLQAQDKLSVVTFARTAHLWVDGVPGNQAAQVAEEVSGLTPEGGTNLEDAMNLAYQTALRHYLIDGVNRVVLLTDGAANLGNVEPEALKQKVEANRKQGIALDCFGIGWEGYNDDLLEVLSRNGDGRYAFLNSPEEVASEFAAKLAGALQVAASDVKVQVEFNPARVTAYRQIGYAKHQLTKEQFRDNTVNAAQIGAAEAGNALYTVEVNPAGAGPLCTVRVRFRIPGTTDYREHAWDVPFTGNAVPLEQTSPAMRLAVTGSAFSEWLASSPYAGEVTPDRLLSYLSGVPEVYGADARPKRLEWMIRQAKSIAGK
jgi:Mg-chelatase subunit ChlD/anti-sigma factor RsiW